MLAYETQPNFLSKLNATEGEHPIPFDNSVTVRLYDLICSLTGGAGVINLQGRGATEFFQLTGYISEPGEDDGPDEDIPVSVSIRSAFAGLKGRGASHFQVLHFNEIGNSDVSQDHKGAKTILEHPRLEISTFRAGVEWLSPHYFSWIGFAPSVEDFFHIEKKDNGLLCRFGGANIASPKSSPFKDETAWIKLNQALGTA